MPDQPKRCWCYICDGRVPVGRSEEGDHVLPFPLQEPAASPERTENA